MMDDREQYGITKTWLRAKIDPDYFSPKKYLSVIICFTGIFGIYLLNFYSQEYRRYYSKHSGVILGLNKSILNCN